jgi:hypothetical protein
MITLRISLAVECPVFLKERKIAMLKFSTGALVALTLLSAPALAAQNVAPSLAILRTFTVEDLQAALDDANAQTPPDTRHAQCWQAAVDFVKNFKPEDKLPQRPGLAQLMQKTFELNTAKSQIPDALVQACALTMADLEVTAAQFARMVGVGVIALPKLPPL